MNDQLRKILVPIDGSETALRALRFAESLAVACRASLVLIHVQEATALELLRVAGVREGRLAGLDTEELVALAGKHVSDPYFASAKLALTNDGIEVETRAAHGSPAREICEFASRDRVDLIVIGARGRSDFNELLLGGVCSQVVHHAPCPVTVVR